MTIEVKLSRVDNIVMVSNDIRVYGEFNIDRIKHWLRTLQAQFNYEDVDGVPDEPDYVVWSYDLEGYVANSQINNIHAIKKAVEQYYKDTLCKGLDLTDNKSQKAELVEMRQVVWAVGRALLRTTYKELGQLYDKKHSNTYIGVQQLKNLIGTDQFLADRIKRIGYSINEPNLIDKI